VDWTFVYLMLGLKLPIAALLWIVWWAVHQTPEEDGIPTGPDDGGSKRPVHPRRPFPRRPRRGPHGDPPLASPPRTRTVLARGRRMDRA
jgi:hypothetical protein